jgi:serine/threonine protein phosphatase 1
MASPRHVLLDLTDRRRVLTATDPHGHFAKLQAALDAVGYDGGRDALILNGDLVDRGPESAAFEDWIARPGVHRTVGNHDVAMRDFLDDRIDHGIMELMGAEWFLGLDPAERRRVAALLEAAPHAITCITPAGRRVGFVHADCSRNWQDTLDVLDHEMRSRRDWASDFTTQSRETLRAIRNAETLSEIGIGAEERATVTGIDHVFHGHSRVAAPFTCGNRTWFDTDACEGPVTVLDVDAWLDGIAEGAASA